MRYHLAVATFMLSLAAVCAPASANTTINVKLLDQGGMMDMSKNMGLGMGMHGNMQMAIMSIAADNKSVPAGKVTFNVVNASSETVHEMIIAPVSGLDVTLPFSVNENRVDEEATGDIGEVSELEAGKSGALTLDLKPGLYVLYCNIPGHFMAGMWTTVEVK